MGVGGGFVGLDEGAKPQVHGGGLGSSEGQFLRASVDGELQVADREEALDDDARIVAALESGDIESATRLVREHIGEAFRTHVGKHGEGM